MRKGPRYERGPLNRTFYLYIHSAPCVFPPALRLCQYGPPIQAQRRIPARIGAALVAQASRGSWSCGCVAEAISVTLAGRLVRRLGLFSTRIT